MGLLLIFLIMNDKQITNKKNDVGYLTMKFDFFSILA